MAKRSAKKDPGLTFEKYVALFGSGYKGPAVVPRTFAMKLLKKSRPAIDRMMAIGDLQHTTIAGVRYVNVASLIAQLEDEAALVEKAYRFLANHVGRRQQPVTYEPLMTHLGLDWKTPADRTHIGDILAKVSRHSAATTGNLANGRLLLSAAVHRKTAARFSRPNPLFFEEAEKILGIKIGDRDQFLREHLAQLYKYYGRRG